MTDDTGRVETLTEMIGRFGLAKHLDYLTSNAGVDPQHDWAVFPLTDRIRCFQLRRFVIQQMPIIRSTLRWDENARVITPLTDTEIPLASAALSNFTRNLKRHIGGYYMGSRGKGEPAITIAMLLYEQIMLAFMLKWEESGPTYSQGWAKIELSPPRTLLEALDAYANLEPDPDSDWNRSEWPLQWSHEFAFAIMELIRDLESCCDMLAQICGTELLEDDRIEKYGGMRIREHLALYGLNDEHIDYSHPRLLEYKPEDTYCAAYIAKALEDIFRAADGGAPYQEMEKSVRFVMSLNELLHVARESIGNIYGYPSRLGNIIQACIAEITGPAMTYKSAWDCLSFERDIAMRKAAQLHGLVTDLAGEMVLDIPPMRHFLGSDGTLLAESSIRSTAPNLRHLGREATKEKPVRHYQCCYCRRWQKLRQGSDLDTDNLRLRCRDRRTCLAIRVATCETAPCVICEKTIFLRSGEFSVRQLRIVCTDEAKCDSAFQ